MGSQARPRWKVDRFCSDVGPPKKPGGRPTTHYFPKDIRRDEKPLMDGIPKRAWEYLAAYQTSRLAAAADPGEPTVYGLCQLYLQWSEGEADAGRITRKQYKQHESILGVFWDFAPRGSRYADRLASGMTTEDFRAFGEAMAAAGHSEHYVRNLCRSARAAFNWAAEPCVGRPRRLIPENGMRGYFPPKPSKVGRYIAPASMRSFLRWAWRRSAAIPPRIIGKESVERSQRWSDLLFVRMLWFLALTGARPGEACNLTWAAIRWDDGVAVLTEWKNKKKTRVDREIFLTPAIVRLLRKCQRRPGRHPDTVFTHRIGKGFGEMAGSTEGMPWNPQAIGQKLRQWRSEAKAAKVPVLTEGANRLVAYIARHSYISDGLMAGASPSELAALCGTSAAMVEETYGHIQRRHSSAKARELAERRRSARE